MKNLKKTLHIALGIALVIVGLLGLVLPILNGIVFLLLGFILLSFESTYIEHHLARIAKRNTTVNTWYEKLLESMKKMFGIH